MTRSKTGTETSHPSQECCMCGDYGLSYELFTCKVCQFRSQHRYCSNLYPKVEANYGVCNWCLIRTDHHQKDETSEKTRVNTSEDDHQYHHKTKKKINIKNAGLVNGNHGAGLIKSAKGSHDHEFDHNLIKKQRQTQVAAAAERSSSPPLFGGRRKRITTIGAMQEKLRRTRSQEISNRGMIRKQVFRNKVRRYKLLHEVITSQ